MHGKESNRPRKKEPEKNAVKTIIYRLLTAAQNECKSCRVQDRKKNSCETASRHGNFYELRN